MITRRRILIAAAVVFVIALVAHAPAATLYAWFGPDQDASARLVGVEGTVFDGRAAGLLVNGRTIAAPLRWDLAALPLLIGRLSMDVESAGDVTAQGHLSLMPGGLDADGLRVSGDVRTLAAAAGQPFVPIAGGVGVDLETLRVRDGLPQTATGRVVINQLAWALGPRSVPLGTFRADIAPQDESIVATIGALDGPLDVDGAATLAPDRSYQVQLRVRAKPDADESVRNLLQTMGRPDAEGWYALRQAGRLPGAASQDDEDDEDA